MRFFMFLTMLTMLGCADQGGKKQTTAAKPSDEYRPIVTLEEFNSLVVGKALTYEKTNVFTVRADGTLDGNFGGPLVGTWRWEDGFWCRTLTEPARPEDCQLWETDGTTLRATRSKGTGSAFFYEM